MGIVWTPDGASPISLETVDISINNSISALYTPTGTEIISGVTATWDYFGGIIIGDWLTLTPSFSNGTASVLISGTSPIDFFDQYSVMYIDKGQSDNTQNPIITNDLNVVPDAKEIYTVVVDPRIKLAISFTVTVYIENNLVPVINYPMSYNFEILQTYTGIQTWVDTYFSTRY